VNKQGTEGLAGWLSLADRGGVDDGGGGSPPFSQGSAINSRGSDGRTEPVRGGKGSHGVVVVVVGGGGGGGRRPVQVKTATSSSGVDEGKSGR